MNPFLNEYGTPYEVPPFDKIGNDDYMPAIEAGISQQMDEINAIIKSEESPDFENVIAAMDRSGSILTKVIYVFFGITNAHTNDTLQALEIEVSQMLTKLSDDIYMNPDLFAKVSSVYVQRNELRLNAEQIRLTEEIWKYFVRGGANLPAADQEKLRTLNGEISMLETKFQQNVLSETNTWQLHITDSSQLKGLSPMQVAAAADCARDAGKEHWMFTLQNPSVMPFLQFADSRELRRKIFKAYISRGNNSNEFDNKETVALLAAKRLEKAKIMGYDNYAEYVLDNSMAKTPDRVYELLDRLWTPALHKAKAEAAGMQQLMDSQPQKYALEAWDWRYYNEKVMSSMFNLDEDMLRPYFKLENVRDGIFHVCNKLYGITFKELKDMPVYHSEVTAFECRDTDDTLLGILYMDFFPRASKRGGAWCGLYRPQSIDAQGRRIVPITYIVCNFTRPSGDVPALLNADETETFFHEFGHALHNLFRNTTYYGTSEVPRDFVELPSQIMEHWAFEPEVLQVYAKHYRTGEVIPADLIKKLKMKGKYGHGFATAEYLAASYLDMDYHTLTEAKDLDVLEFERQSMESRGLIRQVPPRYRSTYFNHTMGGGYTAGYYSYIWAEVLDADAFEAFKEKGDIFDRTTATAFRNHVLEPGGIMDAMEMYRQFRGAEPDIHALIRNRGLDEQ